MKEEHIVLNQLLVDVFNDILMIEQKTLEDQNISLTMNEIHTIDAIATDGEKSMSEVAKELKITLGTLTASINKLVKKGYVSRRRIEEDRRMVLLSLTEEGIIIYRKHRAFHTLMIKNTVSGLDSVEEEILIRAMSKLNEFFKKEVKEIGNEES